MRKFLLICSCVLLGACFASIAILRSEWFSNYLRQRIIAELEQATGAHTSLDRFSFSWSRFSATFEGLTLRGTEPSDRPPLLHAASIRLDLRARYLLTGRIRVSNLDVVSPSVFLLERADGTTNLPVLQSGPARDASDLIRLQLASTRITHGVLQVNDYRTPIALEARNLNLEARYQRRAKRYHIQLDVKQVSLNLAGLQQPGTSLALAGDLTSQHLAVTRLELQIAHSMVRLQGVVRNFARPSIDLRTTVIAYANDIAKAGGLPWLKKGQINIEGQFHYDPRGGAAFTGFASGENVMYSMAGVTVENGSFISRIFITPDLIEVSELRLKALSGTVLGNLAVTNLHKMTFRGNVHGVDLRSFLLLLDKKPLPFDGSVDGPVVLNTRLGNQLTGTLIQAELQVLPVPRERTVSGHVSLTYRQDGNYLTFNSADLQFPNTTVSLSGQLDSAMQLRASTVNSADINPILDWLGLAIPSGIGLHAGTGQASFSGEIDGTLAQPMVKGNFQATNLIVKGKEWVSVKTDFSASGDRLQLESLSLSAPNERIHLTGAIALKHWILEKSSALSLKATVRTNDLGGLAQSLSPRARFLAGGRASTSINVVGSIQNLTGSGGIAIRNLRAFNQPLDQFHAAVVFTGASANITDARLQSGSASTTFQAAYRHSPGDWSNGLLHLRADTNRFGLDTIAALRNRFPQLTARTELHAEGDFRVADQQLDPLAVNGTLSLRDVTLGALHHGDLTLNAATESDLLTMGLAGSLEGSPISGNLHARLWKDDPASGNLSFDKVSLATALAALNPTNPGRPGWNGFFSGTWTFDGPLRRFDGIRSKLTVESVHLRSENPLPGNLAPDQFVLRNSVPIVIETIGPNAIVRTLKLSTRDAEVSVSGSIDLVSRKMDLSASGSTDLRVLELVYPDVQSSGTGAISVAIGGVPDRPNVRGTLQVRNAALILPDFTNGLSAINGTLRFDRNRAILEGVTGQTGGGSIALAGVLTFAANSPLTYNLDAQASHVRFRYLRASVTGDAALRMTGTTKNGLLSGDVSLSRIVFEPGSDLANLLANAAAPGATPVAEQDFLTGLGLDVHIQSSPSLQVVTSLSQDIQSDIDLHLRGTRDHPALIGHISANQGEVNVFGTRYAISRGNITFLNAVRIEPVFDLDLQTETRGITVDVVVTGTLSKLSMSYRSDPPLQAKEIIALLTVGQTPTFASETSNSRVQADTSALQAGATTVLGQAISPASNRLSKLFGVTNVRIDPFVQNLSNSRQARLTLEQQISRDITVTYVTNLAQTSEQVFRFEWSFNPQYSVVAVRDDNGEFGLDIQYKKRFK